jgi:hypothetical protein
VDRAAGDCGLPRIDRQLRQLGRAGRILRRGFDRHRPGRNPGTVELGQTGDEHDARNGESGGRSGHEHVGRVLCPASTQSATRRYDGPRIGFTTPFAFQLAHAAYLAQGDGATSLPARSTGSPWRMV